MQLILRIPELISGISQRVTVTFNVALRDESLQCFPVSLMVFFTSYSSSGTDCWLWASWCMRHIKREWGKKNWMWCYKLQSRMLEQQTETVWVHMGPNSAFLLLALFSIQPRSEDYFLCIAIFTFGWSFLSQLKKGNLIDAGIHVYMGHVLITQGCKWAEMFSSYVCACCSVYRNNCSIWIFHSFCTELN